MKRSTLMCPPLYHHQTQHNGDQDFIMNLYHPLLKGSSHVQSLGQQKRPKVAQQTLHHFLSFIEIEQNVVNSACKWLIFNKLLKGD